MSTVFNLIQGQLPLLVSIPHGGEVLPPVYASRMTPAAAMLADTDWHLGRLYDFCRTLGGSVLKANYSRYVIDLNRPSSGESLYPNQTTTGLCPTESFRGEPLYRAGALPGAIEVANRIDQYWQPYHQALRAELKRLLAEHGRVLLWEAHSIAGVLPRLFEGRLPALNLGNFDGNSCAAAILDAAVGVAAAGPLSWVVNGRFKGGYITRHYGEPQRGVHALQLEMVQSLYMDETAPFAYRQDLAAQMLPTLEQMVHAALNALPAPL